MNVELLRLNHQVGDLISTMDAIAYKIVRSYEMEDQGKVETSKEVQQEMLKALDVLKALQRTMDKLDHVDEKEIVENPVFLEVLKKDDIPAKQMMAPLSYLDKFRALFEKGQPEEVQAKEENVLVPQGVETKATVLNDGIEKKIVQKTPLEVEEQIFTVYKKDNTQTKAFFLQVPIYKKYHDSIKRQERLSSFVPLSILAQPLQQAVPSSGKALL